MSTPPKSGDHCLISGYSWGHPGCGNIRAVRAGICPPSIAKHMAVGEHPEERVRIVMRAHSQPVPVKENTNA